MSDRQQVAVVGSGTWGTTLAIVLARNGHNVRLCAFTPEEGRTLRAERQNAQFLPGFALPEDLLVTDTAEEALEGSGFLLVAVPAQTMRENLISLRAHLSSDTTLISATKGLEADTALRMSEIIAAELPQISVDRVVALSGPNLAKEVAAGLPATSVLASRREETAQAVRALLGSSSFRLYTNSDVVGVELAGALKNVVALAAGICDGLRSGDNAKAAVITRGLAEMARLGQAAGADPLTFTGLAGLGDLVATCSSPLSRNRHVGEQLALGRGLSEIKASMLQVAEGVPTTLAACQLAQRYGVEMPIAMIMRRVLFEGKDVREAALELMTRAPKGEFYGLR